MGFFYRFLARCILNGIALYVASSYLPGFVILGGIPSLAVGAVVLTLLNTFVRPVLKLVTLPLIWITFGLFNVVINMGLLWLADIFLTKLIITDISTLFWASLIVAVANLFF